MVPSFRSANKLYHFNILPNCILHEPHTHAEQHAQILSGPTNQEVLSGEVAMFNCTLACGNHYPVTWYVTLPATMKTVLITPNTQLNQIKSIYGMEVSRGSTNECRSQSGGYRVEQIYVKALKQFHLMPVQCSTVCIAIGGDCGCGAAQLYFSKVALLSVAGIKFKKLHSYLVAVLLRLYSLFRCLPPDANVHFN